MISKKDIIDTLSKALGECAYIDAFWIAGSNAFGRSDDLSDLDLRVLTKPEDEGRVLQKIESALNDLDEIVDKHEPIYSKYPNCFYKLKNTSKYHIIDIVIAFEDTLDELLDEKRMGTPIVLIDHKGLISPKFTNHLLLQEFEKKLDDLKVQFRIGGILVVERAIKRKRFAEAVFFYNTRVIRPLIELLRNKYCPERQDFLLRYLHWDFPAALASTIDELHKISSFEDLERNLNIAERLFLNNI